MAWSTYEAPSHSHLSDEEFDHQYFALIADIWEAFQSGEIGASKREECLKSFRDRMEGIRKARDAARDAAAIAAARAEGLAIQRAVARRNGAASILSKTGAFA
jgi:hypothetical protein